MTAMVIPDLNQVNLRRYVILEHDWNGLHFDLMIQWKGKLKTWRLAEPLQNGTQDIMALPDHRLEYLTYEGAVSGNRGTVKRVEAGVITLLENSESLWKIQLEGTLSGGMTLMHVHSEVWQLHWLARSP